MGLGVGAMGEAPLRPPHQAGRPARRPYPGRLLCASPGGEGGGLGEPELPGLVQFLHGTDQGGRGAVQGGGEAGAAAQVVAGRAEAVGGEEGDAGALGGVTGAGGAVRVVHAAAVGGEAGDER